MAAVRYIVDDVDDAIVFFTTLLGFDLTEHWGGPFAIVERGDMQLWLAGPGSSARKAMPDDRLPVPGGWNRLVLIETDLEATVSRLRAAAATFRSEIVTGPGGRQVLVDDPSGNPVELFQPAIEA